MFKKDEKAVIAQKSLTLAANSETHFNQRLLLKRCLWFTLLTVATIAVLFIFSKGGETLKALKFLQFPYLIFCFFLLFLDLQLGSWRNHIYIRKLNPNLSHWVSFRANVANMFMGAVTPAHSGAGPAQIYVYMRSGVSVIDAFTVSLLNLFATLIFMPVAGIVAIWLLDDKLANGIVPLLLRYGFIFFTLFLVVFLIAFVKPLWISKVLSLSANKLSLLFPKRKVRLMAWSEQCRTNVDLYQRTCRLLLRKNPFLFPLGLLLTTVLYLNKYCMQYFLLMGLGYQTNLLEVISIQVLIQFMIYFAPTPGGSGFAEMSIAVLFGKIIPANVLPLFTLLQRSYLLFFPAIIGAAVVIRLLQKQTKEWNSTENEKDTVSI